MSLLRLVKRGLLFYWRTNLGVLLAAMAGTAVLTGALAVGDSVRHSLKMMVSSRLGRTQLALVTNDRFFRAKLADELANQLNTTVAPVVQLRGLIENSDGTRRANSVVVLGVDPLFFKIGAVGNPLGEGGKEGVVLNEPLAARLAVGVADEVTLRIAQPGLAPRDVPLTPDSDLSVAFRLKVRAVAAESEFGRFSLRANQVAPLNVFVPLEWLQEKVDRTAQANMLLVADSTGDNITVERANQALRKCWQLADAGLELRHLKRQNVLELRSNRIFIDQSITNAAMNAADDSVGILTYFVNELRLGDRVTPYSMVTAIDYPADGHSISAANMQDDEILLSEWLANDLDASVGDSIELTYYVVAPRRRLREQKSTFSVRQILPMESPLLDPELMPDYPGLADVENCRDWKPGITIDLDKIRPRDEEYWDRYRGTPKALITLQAGQAIWTTRYGNLTAVRYPLGSNSRETIEGKILSTVDPASLGLFFQPVRARGLKAGDEATDFGQLFLGLSMFLIASALVLMALIFVFGVESRSEQVGMLLAMGFTPRLVRRVLFIEGGTLAMLGAIAGTATGLLYTKTMIYALATVWRVAVSGSTINFYVKLSTLIAGALVTVGICLAAMSFAVRGQVSRPARELLASELKWQFFTTPHRWPVFKGKIGILVAVLAAVVAAVVLITTGTSEGGTMAIAFFVAGVLLLIAALGLIQALLKMVGSDWRKPMTSLVGFGLRNSTRRSGRSLAVVGLLACGIFLVIAVGANRHNPLAHAQKRDSGTGGFALFGESAIGVLHDLNSRAGRQAVGLDDGGLDGVQIVQLRVNDGDDASCFNLNRAQRPRLLGVQPQQLQMRGAFGSIKTINGVRRDDGWLLLNAKLGEEVVPAIGDYPTITWALGKSLGDELPLLDEKGRSFRLRLVGMLQSSILQGNLLIAEDEFVKRFPSEDGYRMFLVDIAGQDVDKVLEKLSARLTDFGLALMPATQRLAEFNSVQNTYLSIFQLLGGLGLMLGSVGIGLVVLRNVLDRRGELAMMRAVGIGKDALQRMIFYEHAGLMLCGLVCGVVAALVAVGPALKSPSAEVPYLSIALTVAAIAITGLVWLWIATKFALSGKLLEALRNE